MAKVSKLKNTGILEEMTIEEIREFPVEVVVVPLGSTEPHGPHLPYCTDTLRARYTAEKSVRTANSRGAFVLCYPTLPITLDVNFMGFPFALSLRVATFMDMLRDICEQIEKHSVRKIVLVNTHGGNTDVIKAFLRDWSYRQPCEKHKAFVCAVTLPFLEAIKTIDHPSEHAGEDETLEVLTMRSDLVRKDNLREFKSQLPTVKFLRHPQIMWVKPWHLYMPEAACGPTQNIDPQKGKEFVEKNVECLANLLLELSETPWSDEFPYKTHE